MQNREQPDHTPRSGLRPKILAVCAAAAMLILIATGFFARQSGRPVHLIFPAGSRGTFVALEDRDRGIEVPLVNGEYVYRFPEAGPLLVKSNAPMHGWHKTHASFSDGTPLPADFQPANPAGLLLRNSSCGTDGKRNWCSFYIGTLSEEFDPNEPLSELLAVGSPRPATTESRPADSERKSPSPKH